MMASPSYPAFLRKQEPRAASTNMGSRASSLLRTQPAFAETRLIGSQNAAQLQHPEAPNWGVT
jgi:hypothetical protein